MAQKIKVTSAAIEVVCGVMPIKIRIRELCSREYLRIKAKENNHILITLLQHTTRSGLKFCPLAFIDMMSKQLYRKMDGCQLETDACKAVYVNSKMSRIQIISSSYRNDKSTTEKEKDHEEVLKFIQKHQGSSVLVFTDGSVYKGPVGCGACAATLMPLSEYDKEYTECRAVATNVDILTCEIEGIVLGLELVNRYFKERGNSEKSDMVRVHTNVPEKKSRTFQGLFQDFCCIFQVPLPDLYRTLRSIVILKWFLKHNIN